MIRTVFVSSVITGFEAGREAAKRAIESMRLVPIMSEHIGAAAGSPRTALLGEVRDADAYLLILFPRYGAPDESGKSPTEQEFERALELGKPIVALVQEGELELRQREFLERVRGAWGHGRLTGSFSGPEDLQDAVVRALTNLQQSLSGGQDRPGAQARAVELAQGPGPRGSSSGSQARVAFVPASRQILLDVVALEDAELGRAFADAARQTDLAPHAVGLDSTVMREGVRLAGDHPSNWERVELVVYADGAVTVEGPVGGSDNFAWAIIEPERLERLCQQAGAFAQIVWQRIDRHSDVRQVAAVVAVLDANGKVIGPAPDGDSLTIGGAMTMPKVVVAPESGLIVSRSEVGSAELARRLLAEARAVFRDHGALAS